MKYPVLVLLSLTFLFTYFSVGMVNEYVVQIAMARHDEWYPVFTWDLFSRIPNTQDDYHIEILQIGGRIYDPPLRFRDATELFEEINTLPTYYVAHIKSLGRALERGDTDRVQEGQDFIEEIFNEKRPYHYKLYDVRFDPVDFWKEGTYIEKEEVLDVYKEQ